MQGIASRLIANKATEDDLRDYLSKVGYVGATAKFPTLELAAVERPGWVQVFEFEFRATRRNGDCEEGLGLCRSDERTGIFEVQLSVSKQDQQAVLGRESRGMITKSRGPNHWVKTLLMTVFFGAIGIATIGAMLSPAFELEAAPVESIE